MKQIIFFILSSFQLYIKHVSSNKFFCNEKSVTDLGSLIKSCIITEASEYASSHPGLLVSLIEDVKSGYVIQVYNDKTLELWPKTSNVKQKFFLKKDNEFFNIMNSKKCVDFDYGKNVFFMNDCSPSSEQKFILLTNEEYNNELNQFLEKYLTK